MSEARSRGIKANSTCSRCDQDVTLICGIMAPPDLSPFLPVSINGSCRSLEQRVLVYCATFSTLFGAFWQETITSTTHIKTAFLRTRSACSRRTFPAWHSSRTTRRGRCSVSRLDVAVVACGQAVRDLSSLSNRLRVFVLVDFTSFSFLQSAGLEPHNSISLPPTWATPVHSMVY